jgi:hypothetical protein
MLYTILLLFIYLLLFTINNNYFLRGEDDGICTAHGRKHSYASRIRIVSAEHFDLKKMESKHEDVTQDAPPAGDEQLEHQQMDKVYEDMENMTLDNGVMRRKNMKVIVHCNSRSSGHKPAKYEIAVGRGKQNFRWLGLVAAGRYKNECRLNGRLRQREVDATRSGVSQNVPTVCCK